MESLLPVFAVVALASGELSAWSRYPSEAECKRNYDIAQQYKAAIVARAGECEGAAADTLWAQYSEVSANQQVWWNLWWVVSDTKLEDKREAERRVIDLIGPAAWAWCEWPAPLPWQLFALPGERPSISVPGRR